MCYVIITSRTLVWTLLSIATTLSMLAATINPTWLVGRARSPGRGSSDNANANSSRVSGVSVAEDGQVYSPSLGIYNRCTKVHQIDKLYIDSCAPFANNLRDSLDLPNDKFPLFWRASLLFFLTGISIMSLTISMALIGCCIRSIRKKSIFNIAATVQAIAGLFFLLGLIAYPAGWDTKRVQNVCGKDADHFWPADCQLGWALFLAVGTTGATFICSLLSLQADTSTSTDKVQEEILEGKRFICIL